jgi:hypothetical protein
MRSAIPKKTSELREVMQELNDVLHKSDVEQRIDKLAKCCFTIVGEFEKISRDERLGVTRGYFEKTLACLRDVMVRVASENGL